MNTDDDDGGGGHRGQWKEPEEWERGEDKQTDEGGSLAAFKKKAAGHFFHPVKAVMQHTTLTQTHATMHTTCVFFF